MPTSGRKPYHTYVDNIDLQKNTLMDRIVEWRVEHISKRELTLMLAFVVVVLAFAFNCAPSLC